ncbi:LysR substrate-binding domain-containing protein [Telmatospirillum siberiense]|uniref:LysR family transcriptional regulator n=1 Tax=Telmatospirillum siberiense TaxID=382514 RepID=A0A2N3PZ63_9PROT|nr:LysR substrate-binding domain-containing protein [Telmatospirillum siberiense]PKU25651.1 LysR family transcriptional regulator [Telmatospirillum siberiense]
MTLNQLRAFVEVVEHGSIRAAARHLNMEQSGLTQQIKRLEDGLGARLFIRAAKGISLTSEGTELLARARIILGECDRAEQIFRNLHGELSGSINVGVSSELFALLLPPVLQQFRKMHPRVSVHMSAGPSTSLLSALREGRLDFALTLISSGTDTGDFHATFLKKSDPCVLCRKGHPLRDARSIHQIREAEWVNTRPFGRIGTPSNRLADWFAGNGLGIPNMVGSVESLYDTIDLISSSDYLFLAPRIILRKLSLGRHLDCIDVAEPIPESDMCLVERAMIELAPAPKAFSQLLLKHALGVGR